MILDLANAESPKRVCDLLRKAAQLYYDSAGELESAWQDESAGKPWIRIGRDFEALAERIEKREKKNGTF